MLDIKLCVFDLDGTLLNSNKEITQVTIDAIESLKKYNIKYTIATGRIDTLARKYQRQINSDLPIISCNGSLIRDLKNNVLYKEVLDFNIIKKLVNFYKENKLHFMFYTEQCVLSTPNNPRLKLLEKLNLSSNPEDRFEIKILDKNIDCYSNLTYLKALNHIDDRSLLLDTEVKLRELFKGLSIVSSAKELLDIMPTGVTKGSGLSHFCEILNINREQVCVFGDNFNDLEMITFSGISIVPDNGEESIKNIATYITKSNDEDGVAFAINEIILKNV